MSTTQESPAEEEGAQSACDTSLIDAEWEVKKAEHYPPGYPRLCSSDECFGECVPEDAWREDNTAEWDHRDEVDEFVRSSSHGHARHFHRRQRD